MNRRNYTIYALSVLLLLVACTKDSDLVTADKPSAQDAVSFSSYLQKARQSTRATYPAGKAGAMDDAVLKTSGFGVFAQYTENTVWSDYDKSVPFNFMWNQQVDWSSGTSKWSYSPLKYWPNDNQPADDQGAQGSQPHNYLDFFAYAPYVQQSTLPGSSDATADGIVDVTNNSTSTDGSSLYYRTSLEKPFGVDESVDLLWAVPQTDLYKTKDSGEGSVTGTVNLVFKHALSKFYITVQGLFDHVNNDDTSPQYGDDRDMFTHILVERVDFLSSPLFKEGRMYFVPAADKPDEPRWEGQTGKVSLSISGLDINSTLSNSYLDATVKKYWDDTSAETMAASFLQLSDQDGDDDVDATDALALFNQLPTGVTHTEVSLNDEDDVCYAVIPNKSYLDSHPDDPMQIRMVYYVITYDERLTLPKTGYPQYFSIVKNDVTATFSTAFAFEPNKKYKLRLQPGLTTVKFDVTSVDGWDTPITLNPEVIDWVTKTLEYDVK